MTLIFVTVNCQTVHIWWIPVYGSYSALRKQKNNHFDKCLMKYKLSVHSYWAMTPLTLQYQSEKITLKVASQTHIFYWKTRSMREKQNLTPNLRPRHCCLCFTILLIVYELSSLSPTDRVGWIHKSHVHMEPVPLCSLKMILQLADAEKNRDGTQFLHFYTTNAIAVSTGLKCDKPLCWQTNFTMKI